MAFVNDKLRDEERKEYKIPYTEKVKAFCGGTIDRENDIKLFYLSKYLSNGPVMEPSDKYKFLFDYKGDVKFPTLKQIVKGNDISWYLVYSDGLNDNPDALQALREALIVYAANGYQDRYIGFNDKVTTYIMF